MRLKSFQNPRKQDIRNAKGKHKPKAQKRLKKMFKDLKKRYS